MMLLLPICHELILQIVYTQQHQQLRQMYIPNITLKKQWQNSQQAIINGNKAQYKVRRNQFLGRGGFGIVFVAIRMQLVEKLQMQNYDEVVLKEYKKSEKWQNEEDWDKELIIFKKYFNKLNSEFILKVYDIFQEKLTKRYFLAMEYAAGGSLLDRIKSSPRQQEILQFVNRSAQILNFLHHDAFQRFRTKSRNEQQNDKLALIHRDFKPANLVFKNKSSINSMYLIDFGIAKVGYANIPMPFNNSGTNNYKAPEVYQSKNYNAKVDIYSFGCTLYQLFTGGEKLINSIGVQKKLKERQQYIRDKLVDLQFKFNVGEKDKKIRYPNFWLQILYNCLIHDPKERWSSSRLVEFLGSRSVDKSSIGVDYFGESSQQGRLARERRELYEINFQIFRLSLIQQRIFAIFEHLYFRQPRLSKFMLYGILKYVIIFELERFSKIKEKAKMFRRDDKLLLVKRLFEDKKLEEIKKKALQKIKKELEKEKESNRGAIGRETGHIEEMLYKYPELLSQTTPQPKRALFQFCYQQRNAILQDEPFAKMVALILIMMEDLDCYPQLSVSLADLENTDAELLSLKKISKFRPIVDGKVDQGLKQILEGCNVEMSLKSGQNREQCRTDIVLELK